jgi:hypothetical protein
MIRIAQFLVLASHSHYTVLCAFLPQSAAARLVCYVEHGELGWCVGHSELVCWCNTVFAMLTGRTRVAESFFGPWRTRLYAMPDQPVELALCVILCGNRSFGLGGPTRQLQICFRTKSSHLTTHRQSGCARQRSSPRCPCRLGLDVSLLF